MDVETERMNEGRLVQVVVENQHKEQALGKRTEEKIKEAAGSEDGKKREDYVLLDLPQEQG